jgi:hypothetical protein
MSRTLAIETQGFVRSDGSLMFSIIARCLSYVVTKYDAENVMIGSRLGILGKAFWVVDFIFKS